MGTYTQENDKVELARSVMEALAQRKDGDGKPDMITTSQVRKFLTAVNTVTGKIEQYQNEHGGEKTISQELAAQVKFLKVKLAYQIGRADKKSKDIRKASDYEKINDFEKKADLMGAIDSIGVDAEKYREFARYIEALVAFHKYYGGKD